MVKLKQVVMPLIEFIQDNNTTNNLPLRYKGYADMNPHLLSVHNHQVILEKIEARKNLNHDDMWKKNITTMLIVINSIFMKINNSYFIFNIFWTPSGGNALIACKTAKTRFYWIHYQNIYNLTNQVLVVTPISDWNQISIYCKL